MWSRRQVVNSLKRFLWEFYRVWEVADRRTSLLYAVSIILNISEILRTRSFAAADRGMSSRICRFRLTNGHWIVLNGCLFGLAREIYCRGVYFVIPGFRISEGDVVVDLGAHAGVFTLLAATCGKRVLSVEAQSGYIREINANLKRNNCYNKAQVEHGLIGANSGWFSNKNEREKTSHWNIEPPHANAQ